MDSRAGILVFAFLAGFSETLVPDILKKIEAGAGEKTPDAAPATPAERPDPNPP